MQHNLNKAVDIVLYLEGVGVNPKNPDGYVNDKDDAGGETKFGISKKAYPTVDIKNLTKQQAIEIYQRDYWNKCKCSELPDKLDIAVFCCAVNRGCSTASKLLQTIVGASADGVIGPNTIKSINTTSDVFLKFLKADYDKYIDTAKIGNNAKFLDGWKNRLWKMAGKIG